jgi:hypothetical protein
MRFAAGQTPDVTAKLRASARPAPIRFAAARAKNQAWAPMRMP